MSKKGAKDVGGKASKPFNKHQTQGQQNMYNNALPELQANPYVHRFTFMGQQRSAVIQQFPNFGIGGVLWDCELVLAAYLLRTTTAGTELVHEGGCSGDVVKPEPEASKSKPPARSSVGGLPSPPPFEPLTINSLANTSFLELGAGTGLAGVAAWLCGGRSVISDLPEVVAAITAPNVSLNTSATSTIHVPDPNHKPAASSSSKSKGKADETKDESGALYWGDGPIDGAPAEHLIAKTFQNTNAASVLKRKRSLVAMPVSWGVREDCTAARQALQQMLVQEQQQPPSDTTLPTFDVLLAADVIYHSEQHPILLDTIRTLFGINDGDEGDATATGEAGCTKAKKGHHQAKTKKLQQRLIFVHRKRFSYDDDFLEPLKETLQLVAKTAVKHIVPSYPRDNLTIYEFIPRTKPIPNPQPLPNDHADKAPIA